MFNDAGKKIKKVAKEYFVLATIIGEITGIVLLFNGFATNDEVAWAFFALLTMIAAPFVAWVSALMIYGFGEIVDTAIVNRKSEPTTVASKSVRVEPAPPTTTTPNEQPVKKDPRAFNPEDCWSCKGCGTKNVNSRTTCWYCDAEKN